MSQQNDTGFITLIAGEALAAFRRVKMNGTTARSVIYADAGEDFVGVTQAVAALGDQVSVKGRFSPGTFKVEVDGDTTTANANLYGAADGKVSTTVSGEAYFKGLERGTADGAIIEALPFPVFSSANAGGTTASSFQLDNDNSGPTLSNSSGALAVDGAVKSRTNLIVPGFKTGSTTSIADSLAIPVTHGVVVKTTGADAEALTLANGTPGQLLTTILGTDGGGDGTLTPTTKTGFATIVFADAGDMATLLYVDDTVGWILAGAAGVAAPPVITV